MIKDLTQGKPERVLWRFTIPLFISAVFQQLYNMADSIIVGKFAGENALAAVGASYSVTMIFTAVAMGCNVGCSVIVSQLFGAKRYGEVKTTAYTSIISAIIISAVMTVAGICVTPWLMRIMNTPKNIFDDGVLYLTIVIGSFVFMFLYNVANGIFTSLGDSKTPLYFLIASSLGNIGLDVLFVAVFHWDVAGVAWATFIAQAAAGTLAVITVILRLKRLDSEKCRKFSPGLLAKVGKIAVPSVLQNGFVSVGNMLVQTLVNGYGSSVVAGYSAAIKLNTFAVTIMVTVSNGASSFAAQNMGAHRSDRVLKGFKAAVIMAVCILIPFSLLYVFFGKSVISLFINSDSKLAMQTGIEFLRIVAPFYVVVAVKLIADGVLRGAGDMVGFMTATFTDLGLRVGFAYILSAYLGAAGIWASWPVGWVVCTFISLAFIKWGKWRKKQMI